MTNSISNGVHALYELSKNINKLGYESNIVNWGNIIPNDINSIMIYPEVIQGNPLQFTNIVRYMLNKEGFIMGNPLDASPKDYILTWSDLYRKNYHGKLYNIDKNEFEIFNDINTKHALERHIDCTYIGKGSQYSNDCKIIPNTIEINRNNPLTKNALADLLRSTRILYTYDPITLVNFEAVSCGALLVILQYYPFEKEEFKNSDTSIPTVDVTNDSIIIPKSYYQDRLNYINYYKLNSENYLNNLNIVIKDIINHFNDS